MADGAVVRQIVHLGEMAPRQTAARLLLVQEGLDDETGAEDLIARRIMQVGAGHMGHADRLTLAAAQAVLDVLVEGAEFRFLQDDGLLAHQPERGRIGALETRARHQLARVEAPRRIHELLIADEGRQLVGLQELDLGQPDTVLTGDNPPQARSPRP